MVSLSLRTLALAALLALSGAQSLSQQASTPVATFNDATEIVRRSKPMTGPPNCRATTHISATK